MAYNRPHYKSIVYDITTVNQLILIVASLIADVGVVAHHMRATPHPKFFLTRAKHVSKVVEREEKKKKERGEPWEREEEGGP
jgi:hypothetical protein